jgi:hypothetical protein
MKCSPQIHCSQHYELRVIHKEVTSSFVKHKSPLNTFTNTTNNFTSVIQITGEKQKAQKHYFNASSPSQVSRKTQLTLCCTRMKKSRVQFQNTPRNY